FDRFGERLTVRVTHAASLQGFFKAIRYRAHRFPAFIIDGRDRIIGIVAIFVGYNFYARRIDRLVIQADPKRATPAKMYMDGVDFMPTSRNVLYGYHFKSIAAAGPIVGAITAAALWGWFPSLVWLVLGVMFMGWASDYSAIALSVRNDGNSLSAIAHKLIHPRTRQVLFVFIFFYLLLVAGAFGTLVATTLNNPIVPLGIIA